MPLKQSATRYKQKIEIVFVTTQPVYTENFILFFVVVFTKGKQKNKRKVVTEFENIIFTITFIKNVSLITTKIFATECFFTDYLKHKKQIKQLAEYLQKILGSCKHISWRAFQLLQLFLEALRFSNLFEKVILTSF